MEVGDTVYIAKDSKLNSQYSLGGEPCVIVEKEQENWNNTVYFGVQFKNPQLDAKYHIIWCHVWDLTTTNYRAIIQVYERRQLKLKNNDGRTVCANCGTPLKHVHCNTNPYYCPRCEP